jgi:nucleotide-binding universal stress UspA family protein
MTKTIVVALDGSPLAERALGPAAWLGRALPADVRLVRASFAEDSTDEIAYLTAQADATGLERIDQIVVRHQFPAAAIDEIVRTSPDPVVCLTTRGSGALGVILLGSVSDEVLRVVDAPVLVIGPHCRAPGSSPPCIVVSVDGSDASAAVYPVVADWTHALGALVRVVTVAQTGGEQPDDPRELNARAIVQKAVDDLGSLGVTAEAHVLHGADTAELVVAFASGLPAALIAIGTHGQSGLSPKALGGVASDIVRHSPCPVLVRRLPR